MATSFVEYKNYGFWANDSILEAILYLIVKEIKSKSIQQDWLNELNKEWTFAYTAGFTGCIPVNLEENINSEDKKEFLVKSIQEVIINLQNQEDYPTFEELNNNKVGGKVVWFGINKTAFINTIELLLDLLNGKLKTDASSPINYLKF